MNVKIILLYFQEINYVIKQKLYSMHVNWKFDIKLVIKPH